MKIDLLTIIELVAIGSYAASGCLVAIRKHMDYFGVCFLGVITSVGGGALRDIIIGRTPPVLFTNPIFVIMAFIVSNIVFFTMYFHVGVSVFREKNQLMGKIDFWFDTIGLAAFTADGVIVGLTLVENPTVFLTVALGVTTGIGGGILRDILAQQMSAVFVKHVYAVAAIAGALAITVLWDIAGKTYSVIAGFAIIILIRYLAATFHWNMPHVD